MTAGSSVRKPDAAVLEALKSASAVLTMDGASLFEQLVGLECAERGGSLSADVARRLSSSGDEAESQLAANFELNLPSVSLLAQLVAARDAGGRPVPVGAGEKLQSAIEAVTRRTARGLEAKPHLLAAVARSVGILGLTLGDELRLHLESAIQSLDDPIALADVLDAAARIGSMRQQARRGAAQRLVPRQSEPSVALALWWLTARWSRTHGESLLGEDVLDRLRLTALTADYADDVIAAAFMAEAAARDSAELRLTRASDSDRAISRMTQRHLITYYSLWTILAVGLAIIALVNLSILLTGVSHAFGRGVPGKGTQAAVASALFGVMGLSCSLYIAKVVKVISGDELSPNVVAIGVAAVTLAATALGALLYSA
jgi:hypothetical protein